MAIVNVEFKEVELNDRAISQLPSVQAVQSRIKNMQLELAILQHQLRDARMRELATQH